MASKTGTDWGQLALYGGIAIVAYLVWQKLSGAASAVAAVPGQIGVGVSNSIFDALNPAPPPVTVTPSGGIPPGSVTTAGQAYYTTTFPDGSTHAIDASTVNTSSQFSYAGSTWNLIQGNPNQAVPSTSVVSTQ